MKKRRCLIALLAAAAISLCLCSCSFFRAEQLTELVSEEGGKIREEGTYEELMKTKGAYYKMYASQFE